MSRRKTTVRAGAIPDSYLTLVKRHPLTSIRNENELDAAQAVMDALLREDLDDGGQAYLDALSDLCPVAPRNLLPAVSLLYTRAGLTGSSVKPRPSFT
jgi:hypothetical protein